MPVQRQRALAEVKKDDLGNLEVKQLKKVLPVAKHFSWVFVVKMYDQVHRYILPDEVEELNEETD